MKTKLFIFILLCNFAATAQSFEDLSRDGLSNTYLTQLIAKQAHLQDHYKENDTSRNYNGSPYLDEEFQLGNLIKIDSLVFKNLKLRYNIYKDRIEFLNNETIQIVPSENFTKTVMIDNKTFKFTNYTVKNRIHLGFLEELEKGNCHLYYQYKVKFNKAVEVRTHSKAKPAEFVNLPGKFLIQISNKLITHIKNKKQLLEYLSNNKNEILEFIKTEKINLKKKEDFIKLVQYYNKLNKQSI